MKNLFLIFILLSLISCGGGGGGSTPESTTTTGGGGGGQTCSLDQELVGQWSHDTVNAVMEISGTNCRGYNDYCDSVFYISNYTSEIVTEGKSGTATVNIISTDAVQGCPPVGSYVSSFAFGETASGLVLVFTINGNEETYNKIE